MTRFGIALCVLTLSRFAWGHVAVTGAPAVTCTHEMTGNDFTQLTLGQTPCPSSPAAAAAAPTVPDPIELYAISYRDEANDQMYSVGYEGITVPPAPTYSTNQAFRWVIRLFGNAVKTGGQNLTFEASVGYGHLPLVDGTVDGEYSVWTALGVADQWYYTTPVRVSPGDNLSLGVEMTEVIPSFGGPTDPEQALFDPQALTQWQLSVQRGEEVVTYSRWSGGTLYWEDYETLVSVMALHGLPGVNIPSCSLALPQTGSELASEFTALVPSPTNPYVVGTAHQMTVSFSNVQSIPNDCGFSQDNVQVLDTHDVLFTWPTNPQAPPPGAVPAAPPVAILLAGLLVAGIGGVLLRRGRAS